MNVAFEPPITVFVLSHERMPFLQDCIESILAQSMPHFRVVVLDNASTGDVHSAVAKFGDARLSVIRHDVNIGSRANINLALKLAATEFFLIFHDDDTMHPALLETELGVMEGDPSLAFIGAGYRPVEHHEQMSSFTTFGEVAIDRFADAPALVRFLMDIADLHFGSVMYRRACAMGHSLEGDKYGRMADRPLLVSIAVGRRSACLRGPWVNYRLHPHQDTHLGPLDEAQVRAFLASYREVLEPGWDAVTRRRFYRYASNVFLDSYAVLPRRQRTSLPAALKRAVADGILHPLFIRRQGGVALLRTLMETVTLRVQRFTGRDG